MQREREESAAREEAVATAAKKRIDKVKEAAKAQVPAKLKEASLTMCSGFLDHV